MNVFLPVLSVFSLSLGMITTVLTTTVFYKEHSVAATHLKLSLLFLSLFTLVQTVLLWYGGIYGGAGSILPYLVLFSRIFVLCFLLSFTLLTHTLLRLTERASIRNLIYTVALLLILTSIIEVFFTIRSTHPTYRSLHEFSIIDFTFLIIPLYNLIILIVYNRRIISSSIYKIIRAFFYLFAGFTPLLIISDLASETILEGHLLFTLYLLFYILFNSLLLFYGIKHIVLTDEGITGTYPDPGRLKRYGITKREGEIIGLLAEGYRNKEIAESLYISAATVRNHLHNIFSKTGSVTRIELLNKMK